MSKRAELALILLVVLATFIVLAISIDNVTVAFILGMIWSAISEEIRRKHNES